MMQQCSVCKSYVLEVMSACKTCMNRARINNGNIDELERRISQAVKMLNQANEILNHAGETTNAHRTFNEQIIKILKGE
jgi:hypothetical protein